VDDRDITIYTLNLERNAKELILCYVEDLVMPDNCYYDYHEFRNNCATGIRDILDLGVHGQLKAAFAGISGRLTIREHVRRFTWSHPFSDWFLGFLMGQDLDQPVTPWEEMFLPVEIARNIVDFKYIDDSGTERKLVSSVQVFNSSKSRQPVLNEPLHTWPFFLTAGLIIGALLFFLNARRNKHPRLCRIINGIIQSLLGLILSASGLVLFIGLFIMNNDYIKQNVNILFVNPLLFVIVPLGILSAIGKPFRINLDRCLRIIWTCVFIAGSFTVFIKALPFFYQQNQSVQGLVLPVAFALSGIWEGRYKLKPLARKMRKKSG
jgi:hypothetical protein